MVNGDTAEDEREESERRQRVVNSSESVWRRNMCMAMHAWTPTDGAYTYVISE